MIVITLTNAPSSLKGDLSEWLLEISPGVYIGNLTRRVREKLWGRICSTIKTGRATMAYSTNTEQGFDFCTHGDTWEPRDFEGMKLIYRPFNTSKESLNESENFSLAAKGQKAKAVQKNAFSQFAFLDLETTGLNPEKDQILEVGVILTDHELTETGRFSWLIQVECVPEKISELTGITSEMSQKDGLPLNEVILKLFKLMENRTIIIQNASFDLAFLSKASEKLDIDMGNFRSVDTMVLAKRQFRRLKHYGLDDLCERLSIQVKERHRALPDAELVMKVFEKLRNCSEEKLESKI